MKYLFILTSIILFSSCATMFTRSYQTVHFQTTVPGAKVIVNDNLLGVTPCDIKIKKRMEAANVIIKLDGYDNKYITMGQKVSGVTFLNIFNLGIGVIVDVLTGKVWKFERSYNIDLDKGKPN